MAQFWRRTVCFAIAIIILPTTGAVLGQVIRLEDFKPADDGIPGEERYERTIEIGPNTNVRAAAEVTVRRNGILKVGNLKLKIIDEYDDGVLYDEGLLHVEFVDVTGDGYKDVVICGTVRKTGEKETDPQTIEPVCAIFRFVPEANRFERVYRLGINLES